MIELQNGEQAGRWLLSKLKKLEVGVTEAPELQRLIGAGSREVLVDVEADPQLFVRDAADRMRRFTSQVSRATLEKTGKEGFKLDVLERYAIGLVASDPEAAPQVLSAMAEALRQRVAELGADGGRRHDGGQAAYADSVGRIGVEVQRALRRWTEKGPGRRLHSLLPWRRRKARRMRPMEDPTFQVDVAAAARKQRGELEGALKAAGTGAVTLTIAKYYGDIVTVLAGYEQLAQTLRDKAQPIVARAQQRLTEVRRSVETREIPRTTDWSLLDDDLLDAVLDRLGVDADAFLRQAGGGAQDLAQLTTQALEERVREWVGGQLGGLVMPTLSEALSGLSSEDQASARRRLQQFLAQGQPLVHFDDELNTQFPNGMPAQYFVMAEATDGSVRQLFADACNRIGLPNPRLEVLPPAVEEEGQISLRVMQFVAGIPFFAQVERLMSMIRTHRETLSQKGSGGLSDGGLPVALRDMIVSEELPELLPESIERSFERRLAFDDHHYEPLDEDDRGAPKGGRGGDAGVTPFPVPGSGNARG